MFVVWNLKPFVLHFEKKAMYFNLVLCYFICPYLCCRHKITSWNNIVLFATIIFICLCYVAVQAHVVCWNVALKMPQDWVIVNCCSNKFPKELEWVEWGFWNIGQFHCLWLFVNACDPSFLQSNDNSRKHDHS